MEVVHVDGRSVESKRLSLSGARSLKRLCTVPVLCDVLSELVRFLFRPLLEVCKHMNLISVPAKKLLHAHQSMVCDCLTDDYTI